MNATRQFNITLPRDLAALIDSEIKAGAYASVRDLVADSVRALRDRDAALDRWLRDDVVRGHADYLADPSRAIPAEDVLDRIKARRRDHERS